MNNEKCLEEILERIRNEEHFKTDEERETAIKKTKENFLLMDTMHLFPGLMIKYYDTDSEELLDKKLEILTKLKDGASYANIPDFEDIFEKLPRNKTEIIDGEEIVTEAMWD